MLNAVSNIVFRQISRNIEYYEQSIITNKLLAIAISF